jgi:LacI family transcriptional regulator
MEILTRSPERVTVQDIADHLGISKATVSRALTQRPRVAPETRKRVQDAATALGYTPDPTLRALSKHRWASKREERFLYRIAIVEINSLRHRSTAPARIDPSIQGASERAAELGIGVELFAYEQYAKAARLGDVLYHRGYNGVLFSIRGPVTDWEFPWEKFSCLAVSFDHPSHRLHQVCSDWFNAVFVAMNDILARGYQRPGIVHFKRDNPSIDQRTLAAFKLWHEDISLRFGQLPPIFCCDANPGSAGDAYQAYKQPFQHWLTAHQPDVVVDGGAMAYWWMKDAGVRVPDDMGYTRLRHSEFNQPQYANGVDHRLIEQGRWSVDLLYSMMQLNVRGLSDPPIRISVKCRTQEGTTLRPLPPAST